MKTQILKICQVQESLCIENGGKLGLGERLSQINCAKQESQIFVLPFLVLTKEKREEDEINLILTHSVKSALTYLLV